VRFLLGKIKGGSRALGACLGISQRSVQRFAKGTVTVPRVYIREAMEAEAAGRPARYAASSSA
jgi:hypothetical protein